MPEFGGLLEPGRLSIVQRSSINLWSEPLKTLFFSLILVLASSQLSFAQMEPEMKPVGELPDTVKTTDGEVGLFVDWETDKNSAAKVYIVNRSEEPVTLRHAYGSAYLKMEADNGKGVWERAEFHISETCGTGLGEFTLQPGHWMTQTHRIQTELPAKQNTEAIENEIKEIRDFMARARLTQEAYNERMNKIAALEKQLADADQTNFEMRTVRLRIYDAGSRAISNSGQAVVNLSFIEKAKHDVFAITFADIERLRAIILGTEEIEVRKPEFGLPFVPREIAIYSLGQSTHSIEDVTDILQSVIENESETLVEIAKEKLEEIQNR